MELKFNNRLLPDFVKVKSIKNTLLPSISQNTLKVKGKAGVYDFGNEIGEREIEVSLVLIARDEVDLKDRERELAEWLYTDDAKELVLKNDLDKYYLAKVTGDSGIDELFHTGEVAITFFCADPYAYSTTTNRVIPLDSEGYDGDDFYVRNAATETTYPEIRFTIDENTTELYIHSSQHHNEKQMFFGKPKEIDIEAYDPDPVVFHDDMNSSSGWASASDIDDGVIRGSFYSNGYSVSVVDYGSDEGVSGWYGPSGIKNFIQPVSDFRCEAKIGLKASEVGELGRIEIYFLDSNGVQIGKQALRIGSPSYVHPFAQVRLGNRYVLGDMSYGNIKGTYGDYKGVWDDWKKGKMAIARRGNVWSFYYAITEDGRDVATLSRNFTASDEIALRDVAKIQIHLGTHTYGGLNPPKTIWIEDLKVENLDVDQPTADGSYSPLVFKRGDDVIVDMDKGAVLKNGQPYYQYLDPSSRFFGVESGEAAIYFRPKGLVRNVGIAVRERWL